ncbi:MAG: c-type cytochrome [Acidimicrobiia bacterium]|nr:c-type cytochrome [Acidimicrobiia bacterium]
MKRLFALTLLTGLVACSTSASPDVTRVRDPGSIAAGSALYGANCARCHGADLAGGRGESGGFAPSLAAKVGPGDAVLLEIVKRGAGMGMPSFATQLEESAIVSIIDYVRSVQAERLDE